MAPPCDSTRRIDYAYEHEHEGERDDDTYAGKAGNSATVMPL